MTTKTISRFRGDTKRVTAQVQDKDQQPVDITGWSAVLTINAEEFPTDTSQQIGTPITGTIQDAANGQFAFVPSGTEPVGDYFFDIQMTDNLGEVFTMLKGEYKVRQDISK